MNFSTSFIVVGLVKAISAGFWSRCPRSGPPAGHEQLDTTLDNKLYGQHIVVETVPSIVKNHIDQTEPKKPLVISFHGDSGIGKTYVTELIARYIYGDEGTKSEFVHTFIGDDYFDATRIQDYKEIFRKKIVDLTKKCERSLFVFSEVESMQHGIFDAIRPYLGTKTNVDKLDFRRNIFIFSSNIGSNKINELTIENMKSGLPRKAITRKVMDEVLTHISLSTGGLEKSLLITTGLVDFFMPFLPLTKFHVKQCILEELYSRRNFKRCDGNVLELVDQIADEVQYNEQDLARNGCKMIFKKVDMHFTPTV